MIKPSGFAALLAVLLLVLAVACGGGDDDDTPSTSTNGAVGPTASDSTGSTGGSTAGESTGTGGATGAPSTGSAGASTGAASTGSTGPAGDGETSSDDFDLEDCPELQALVESAGMEDASSANVLSGDFNVENFQRLADNSPGEIRADMQLLAGALAEFFGKLEELDVDFSNPASFATLTEAELAELEELSTELDTPEITAASQRVEAYFAEVCS